MGETELKRTEQYVQDVERAIAQQRQCLLRLDPDSNAAAIIRQGICLSEDFLAVELERLAALRKLGEA